MGFYRLCMHTGRPTRIHKVDRMIYSSMGVYKTLNIVVYSPFIAMNDRSLASYFEYYRKKGGNLKVVNGLNSWKIEI